ncbi:putative transporter (transmembrane protein) [Asanoa ferruginea]|uniref:Putative transporter (Transmembrane protein) n=1 Tax=Asanoa ferruginea TaxID=53367 RepID=A0A3D9ZMW0_9ACTN|nr:putative transporter (transmembrane protein) [Asanoa ferruginea]GIF50618.1 hypothetical protein Afe04nite_51570 [Asanoa ferruginea]
MDIGAALTDMWRSVLLFVPKALAFLAILLVGYLIARVVRRLVDTLLTRVGFDRAVQRSGIGRRLASSRYDASDILARLAYYAILLFALQLAFGVWGPNPISDLISAVVGWLPRAFVAIVIVVVATAIASAVRDLINGALGGLSYGKLIATVVWVFIVGLGVIAALNQVGIATTVTTPVLIAVLATIAGILIVGVGGGLVRPMQGRWDRWLDRMAAESAVIRERAQAYQTEKADAERRRIDEQRQAEEQARAAAEAARVEAARVEAEEAARVEAARVEAEAAREESARVEAARVEAAQREAAAQAEIDRAQTTVISTEAEQTQVIPRPEDAHIVPGMEPAPVEPEPEPAPSPRRGRGKPTVANPTPTRELPAVTESAAGDDPSAEQTQVIRPRDGRDS